jgi:hypothetical protein
MVIPVFLLMLLGMLELGFAFDHALTIQYATREGARVGAALSNGGGSLGCNAGQSPNASTVDPLIIAAVNRVLKSPGSRVHVNDVPTIRIYKATSTGAQSGGFVNVWTYSVGAGPLVDGTRLDYVLSSTGWSACSRFNGNPPDSIGVSLTYTYRFITPLGNMMAFFGGPGSTATLAISDRTVMALNPTE